MQLDVARIRRRGVIETRLHPRDEAVDLVVRRPRSPGGGIIRLRNCRTALSQISALSAIASGLIGSNERFAVRSTSLWQSAQYLVKSGQCSSLCARNCSGEARFRNRTATRPHTARTPLASRVPAASSPAPEATIVIVPEVAPENLEGERQEQIGVAPLGVELGRGFGGEDFVGIASLREQFCRRSKIVLYICCWALSSASDMTGPLPGTMRVPSFAISSSVSNASTIPTNHPPVHQSTIGQTSFETTPPTATRSRPGRMPTGRHPCAPSISGRIRRGAFRIEARHVVGIVERRLWPRRRRQRRIVLA